MLERHGLENLGGSGSITVRHRMMAGRDQHTEICDSHLKVRGNQIHPDLAVEFRKVITLGFKATDN